MLKKIIPFLGVLFFAIFILAVSLKTACENPASIFAMASLKFSVSPSATDSAKQTVDYYLVYPGILPDHPLYRFKMIRDRIKILLTREPLSRAQLFLLFADKRVGAGKVLIEGNKVPLGLSTILKGEKYLEKSISEVSKAKKNGNNTGQITEKLAQASLKYEEVFLDLKEKINPEGITAMEESIRFLKLLQERIIALSL